MKAKRIVRWGIVLFLLLALPVVTAALAQGQEPPAEQLPPTVETGESAVAIPWNNDESEPNDSVNTADETCANDRILGGRIGSNGDVDYWKVDSCYAGLLHNRVGTLFDVDANSFGSPVDAVICLYSDDGYELACNDDTEGPDSMLYYNLEAGRSYYLKVRNSGSGGGSAFKYQLLISDPLLISASAAKLGAAVVDGIPIKAGDILAWTNFYYRSAFYEKWVMLFDISDLNVNGNLTNLAAGWRNSDTLLLGFAANITLPGISGTVTPTDVVVFDPTTIGPKTAGTFQRWWAGNGQGLATKAERIDAIDWPDWNGTTRLSVSTTGTATVTSEAGTLKLADEDVGTWSGSGGTWVPYFDGNGLHGFGNLNWRLGTKDVVAYSTIEVTDLSEYGDWDWWSNVVLQGTGAFNYIDYNGSSHTVNATQKDIVMFNYHSDPDLSYGFADVWWHGPDHGWNYNIDAIEWDGW